MPVAVVRAAVAEAVAVGDVPRRHIPRRAVELEARRRHRVHVSRCWLVLGLALSSGFAMADDAATVELPKVVLVGDSIRLSYAECVLNQLDGEAVVVSPRANGGDSSNVLKHLDTWVIDERPSVVHFNCGIHDIKRFKATGKFQVSPDEYEANLRNIVQRIRQRTDALVVFATTTPILDDRAAAARRDRDYELLNASVNRYNAIAKRLMGELDVPVNDLNSLLSDPSPPLKTGALIGTDGVHLTPAATELLGVAVAACIREHSAPAND